MTLEHEKLKRQAEDARKKLKRFKVEEKYVSEIKSLKKKEFERSKLGRLLSAATKVSKGIEKGSNKIYSKRKKKRGLF